jgi:hypothetical protein
MKSSRNKFDDQKVTLEPSGKIGGSNTHTRCIAAGT